MRRGDQFRRGSHLRSDALAGWVRTRAGWQRTALATSAGALSVLAMAPFLMWPVLIATLAVLVWLLDGAILRGPAKAWRSRPAAQAALVGWLFAFGYFFVGLFWIGEAFLNEMANLPQHRRNLRGGQFTHQIIHQLNRHHARMLPAGEGLIGQRFDHPVNSRNRWRASGIDAGAHAQQVCELLGKRAVDRKPTHLRHGRCHPERVRHGWDVDRQLARAEGVLSAINAHQRFA